MCNGTERKKNHRFISCFWFICIKMSRLLKISVINSESNLRNGALDPNPTPDKCVKVQQFFHRAMINDNHIAACKSQIIVENGTLYERATSLSHL